MLAPSTGWLPHAGESDVLRRAPPAGLAAGPSTAPSNAHIMRPHKRARLVPPRGKLCVYAGESGVRETQRATGGHLGDVVLTVRYGLSGHPRSNADASPLGPPRPLRAPAKDANSTRNAEDPTADMPRWGLRKEVRVEKRFEGAGCRSIIATYARASDARNRPEAFEPASRSRWSARFQARAWRPSSARRSAGCRYRTWP